MVSKTEERVLKMFSIFLLTPISRVLRRYVTTVSIFARSCERLFVLDLSFSYISSLRSFTLN